MAPQSMWALGRGLLCLLSQPCPAGCPTFDTQLCEAELAVVVPKHEVEVLPCQLLLVLEA